MCGIVGYVGQEQAAPILLDGLSKLEYRGYDSAGLAVSGQSNIEVVKAKGRLHVLNDMTDSGRTVTGTCGIGHTRWATHGEPSVPNAHPHCNADKSIAVVHNGIIENYTDIKEFLVKKGYSFQSSTDTETVALLLEYYYEESGRKNPLEAITKMMNRVRGAYALGILFADIPDTVFAVRKDSPLIVGQNETGTLIASDVPAILKYTRDVYYIDNLEIAKLAGDNITFYNMDMEEIQKKCVHIDWDAEAAEKGGFEHFMIKEIHEQPRAVRDTLGTCVREEGDSISLDMSAYGISEETIRNLDRICIIGCGSAYHVGVVAKYVIEDLARIPVDIDLASEFRYRRPILSPNTLVVVISQSGETADSLAALREAQRQGNKVLGIVNVVGSTIAREADYVYYTMAGPEIAVATTKAYSTQLIASFLWAIHFAQVRGNLDAEQAAGLLRSLMALPDQITRVLEDKERIQWFASKYASTQDVFFIGRGVDYAVSMEGSLKLKEISYIHSEAYAAGELKHGTISLIEEGTLCTCVLTQPELYEKMISNMVEVRSRGGYLMALTTVGNYNVENTADFTVYVPRTDSHFTPALSIIPLQLLAYYVSCAKGLDVDKPRNLAKSVTVE